MKRIVLSGKGIVTGNGSIKFLSTFVKQRVFIVVGGNSLFKSGVIDRCCAQLRDAECEYELFSGIKKNPTIQEIQQGVAAMKQFKPDMVLAIGGGSVMDAAKGMLLFYEFPEITFENVLEKKKNGEIPVKRKTQLVCIPSTSGTGSEVTKTSVITDPEKKLKVPIITDCLRPDYAILDSEVVMTMPRSIAAETGLDALTHAIEAYTNHNLDDIDEIICSGAILGILKWLPVSCNQCTLESREKIHTYQALAGIGFANVGLGAVHGIAHSFGAAYNMAHGLTNAIILPYILKFNSSDAVVNEKLKTLSQRFGTEDIIEEIKKVCRTLDIPGSFAEAGIMEDDFKRDYDLILEHAMLGATNVNPVKINIETMKKLLNTVYYGV